METRGKCRDVLDVAKIGLDMVHLHVVVLTMEPARKAMDISFISTQIEWVKNSSI